MVWMERSAMPGKTSARYLRMGTSRRRQLSITLKMAAIFGPASLLPKCSQFFLPMAIGLIEFSAQFVESSSTGCFMKHPVLELSTNWAENSMRPIAIGRKNWLHLGSKEAGPKIAAIFSVIESCRRLDVPIRKYLAEVLPGMADRSIQTMDKFT